MTTEVQMQETLAASDDAAALIAFVSARDVECPSCGYNLRGLKGVVCPECRQKLHLTVGARPRTGLLIAALAPSMFSGIAGCFVTFGLIMQTLNGFPPSFPPIILASFGLLSGLFGVVVTIRHRRFQDMPPVNQRRWVTFTWIIHLAAAVILFAGIILL